MTVSDVAKDYLAVARSDGRVNLLHNGDFTRYEQSLKLYQDIGEQRNGLYDLVDERLYFPVSKSFSIASEAGKENVIGHWDIWGVSGSIEIAPVDTTTGAVIPSFDGGNLIRVSFIDNGTINLDQDIADIAAIRGKRLSFAFSGRKFSKDVTIRLILLDQDEEIYSKSFSTTTFGKYRRVFDSVIAPSTLSSLKVRLALDGLVGASVGLSGLTAILGPTGPTIPYVPSIGDITIPSGTVILWGGDVCPSGYKVVNEGTDRMALTTGGPAYFRNTDGTVFLSGGQDSHDHDPNGAVDGLDEPSTAKHTTKTPIPNSAQATIHGIKFGEQPTFPGEKPVKALGIKHSHKLATKMNSAPPTFPMKFCVKL